MFGWGFNVRECKLACIQGVNRIKMFRNKKMNELAGERRVVADHINKGNSEMGMMRVEQVMRLKNILKAIEIMELFLEMIKTRLDYLSKQKQIPSEMRTPMLSIAYASTRLTDIPELSGIRKSFESRFGREAFAEVTKGDPGPASGVQENLLYYLSVMPPSVPEKVEAAMDVMTELGTTDTDPEDQRAELERAAGMFAPRPGPGTPPGGSSSGGGTSLQGGWLPATIPAPAPEMDPNYVQDPTPVNDYGNPAPSYQAFQQDPKPFSPTAASAGGIPVAPAAGGIPAEALAAPTQPRANPAPTPAPAPASAAPTVPAAVPPAQPVAAPPSFPYMPTGTVPPPLPPNDPSHAQPVDSESYTGAMKAAMAGASPSDSSAPVLDSTNAGTEGYPGAFVMGSEGRAGSMPSPPPGANNKTGTTAADLMFPDVKWSDTPPSYSLENSLGSLPAAPPPAPHDSFPTPPAPGSDFGLPPAPSHDPELPSAPKFSHTGVVYDENSLDEEEKSDVQDDLLERFKKLNR